MEFVFKREGCCGLGMGEGCRGIVLDEGGVVSCGGWCIRRVIGGVLS